MINHNFSDGGPDEHPFAVFCREKPDSSGGLPIGLPRYGVNTTNLGLVIQDLLYGYSGQGPKIAFILTYNHNPGRTGMFGRNWNFSYHVRLVREGGTVTVIKGSGQMLRFQVSGPAPQGAAQPAELRSLDGSSDRLLDYQTYWLFVEDRTRLTYTFVKDPGTRNGQLVTLADTEGNAVRFAYNPDGTLSSLEDAAGRITRFSYQENGYCTSLVLPDGRKAAFSYDSSGNLIQSLDLMEIPSLYAYDAGHALERMTVARDNKETTFFYHGEGREKMISAVTDAAGNTTRYDLISRDPFRVRVTDPEGNATVFESRNNKTEKITDPLGNTDEWVYRNGQPVVHTDMYGNSARFEYDAFGNRIKITDPLGNEWKFTFNPYRRPLSATNPDQMTWSYVYDANQNLVRTISPAGKSTAFHYDQKNNLVRISDARGREVAYTYDRYGNVSAISDATVTRMHMEYDAYGFTITAITDAKGQVFRYEYDKNDRLVRTIHPDGTSRQKTFGCCAQTAAVNENNNGTEVTRNPLLSIVSETGLDGFTTFFEYDKNQRMIRAVNPLRETTSYTYDAIGRIATITRPSGDVVSFGYGKNPRSVTLGYNSVRLLTQFFDGNNVLVRQTDASDTPTTYTLDRLSRVSAKRNGRGQEVRTTYAPSGGLSSLEHDGKTVYRLDYNPDNRLERIVSKSRTVTLGYNDRDQVIRVDYADLGFLSFTYDETGKLSSLTYPDGFLVRYLYDNRGRTAEIRCDAADPIRFVYDNVGNVIRITRGTATESSFSYTRANRVSELLHKAGESVLAKRTYTYDPLGRVVGETGTADDDFAFPPCDEAYHYPGSHRMTDWNGDRCTYDRDGNLISAGGEKWSAEYDAENVLVRFIRNGKSTEYTRNGFGFRGSKSSGGSTDHYLYDQYGRLLTIVSDNGRSALNVIYNGNRVVATRSSKNGLRYYHFDARGDTLVVTDEQSAVSASFGYDPYGSVIHRKGAGSQTIPFTFIGEYGVLDDGNGLYFMKNRYYDPRLRTFIQPDPVHVPSEGLHPYAYAIHNPVNYIDPDGLKVCNPGDLAARWLIWGVKSGLSLHPVTAPYYKGLQYGVYGVETLHGVTAAPDGSLEISSTDPDANEAAGKLAWRGTKDGIQAIFGKTVGNFIKKSEIIYKGVELLIDTVDTVTPEIKPQPMYEIPLHPVNMPPPITKPCFIGPAKEYTEVNPDYSGVPLGW